MYNGPIIDCDVHNTWVTPRDLAEYLPHHWREQVLGGDDEPLLDLVPGRNTIPRFDGGTRLDALPPGGGAAGSSYELMRDQLLDKFGIVAALLEFNIGLQSGMQNPYFATAVCEAANRWCAEHWLARDPRLFGSLLVASDLPDLAAAEVRRWAGHPQVKQVLLLVNTLGKPFGHPVYDPIFAAAQESGLQIAMHVGNESASKGRESAGGQVGTILEKYVNNVSVGMHYLTSFITNGVFEKFPALKLMMVEMRFTWLPHVMWRLDSCYPMLRAESPHVKRLPSEYMADHVRLSTQPFDYVSPKQMRQLLGSCPQMQHMICFASDYPHWDADDPARSLEKRLPTGWADDVFWGNAAAFYGFDRDAAAAGLRGRPVAVGARESEGL